MHVLMILDTVYRAKILSAKSTIATTSQYCEFNATGVLQQHILNFPIFQCSLNAYYFSYYFED